jgi:hypothetical protein
MAVLGSPGVVSRDAISAGLGRAAAAPGGIAAPAARARIHGGDELAGGGEIGLPRRARNGDGARFERLAQGLQHMTVELGQLVKE